MEFQDAIAEINIPTVVSKLVNKHVYFIWTFNPPSSPWIGEVWEALIKPAKRALKTITGDCLFTEEGFHTFICEVKSILNIWLITLSSDDINDYEALTPITSCLNIYHQTMHQVHFEMMKSIIEKSGVCSKQQPICFGAVASRNIYQSSFRDENSITHHQT